MLTFCMAAPGALVIYDSFRGWIGDGTFDMNSNTFKAALVTSSYTPAQTTDQLWGDSGISSNEVANGNGYTTGGVTLTSPTFNVTASVAAFKSSTNPSWTGASSGFVARYLVIYASGTLNGHLNPLVGYMLLDSAPANVSFAVGNSVTITWNASGIFTLS